MATVRKYVRPWHKEAVKLILNGLTLTDVAQRMSRSRTTLSRFVNSNLFEQVKQELIHFDAKTDIPSVAVATNNTLLEQERVKRVRLAWETVDEALQSDEVPLSMKAKIAIEVLKGHGELTEKVQHDHKHLGIMLLQANQDPEEWEQIDGESDMETATEATESFILSG